MRRRRLRRTLDGESGAGRPWTWLGVAAAAFLLSLGAVVRVSAMPAEARTEETWYSYRHELRYDFSARVAPGPVYSRDLVAAADLIQSRSPTDPPTYRRVLVGPMTDSVRIALPYRFTADRPATLQVTYEVGGTLGVPNLWRKPYRLLAPRTVTLEGAQVHLDDLAVDVPVRALVAEVQRLGREFQIPYDAIEIRLRPVVQVVARGLPEPVESQLTHEVLLLVRGGGTVIEVDEPRLVQDSQALQTAATVPVTLRMGPWQAPVARLRLAAYLALLLFGGALAASLGLRWAARRRGEVDLERLGPGLITVSEVALPAGIAVVDVAQPADLIALHLQTERPVMQAGAICYLIDGQTCYRFLRARHRTT